MLFDHGADAVSAFLIGGQVIKILDLTYSFRILTIFIFIMIVYFCAMWSQYTVGYFKLGRINPVDEGLPGYVLGCLAATQVDLRLVSKLHIIGTYGE